MAGIDARAKLIVYLASMALVLATGEIVVLAVEVALLVVALGVVSRPASLLGLLRLLAPTLLLFGIVAWLSGGLPAAAVAVLRLAGLTAAGALLFAVTTPEALADALAASGLPGRYAFLVGASIRFVPLLVTLIDEVRIAQASRGVKVEGWHLVHHAPALLGPVLVGAVHLADDLAEALETRGFAEPHHTRLGNVRWRWRDSFVVSVTVALVLLPGRWLYGV